MIVEGVYVSGGGEDEKMFEADRKFTTAHSSSHIYYVVGLTSAHYRLVSTCLP